MGIEYTNDPRALREELVDGSVVVMNTMVVVSRGVICTWRVVCGERGRGRESCWGCCVGDAEVAAAAVGSGSDRARDGASTDLDMIRGMSEVRYYVLVFTPVLQMHVVHSPQPYVLGALRHTHVRTPSVRQ